MYEQIITSYYRSWI